MTVSHFAQMLLKLEKCIPISHVTLETVPKYANIKRPTSSQLYVSEKLYLFIVYHVPCLLQNETEQNVLFVDAFTLNCFLTDFHGG